MKFTLDWMNTCSPWNGVVKLQGVWFIFGAQKEEMEAKFFLYANIHFFRPILHKFSFKNKFLDFKMKYEYYELWRLILQRHC